MIRTDRARFWAKHIARQRRGGLTRRAYCAKHALALSSFGYCSRKQRGSEVALAPGVANLVPVELVAEPLAPRGRSAASPSGVGLHTGAVRIELAVGFDVPTLRRALEALGC